MYLFYIFIAARLYTNNFCPRRIMINLYWFLLYEIISNNIFWFWHRIEITLGLVGAGSTGSTKRAGNPQLSKETTIRTKP